jgi:hypothetical protein
VRVYVGGCLGHTYSQERARFKKKTTVSSADIAAANELVKQKAALTWTPSDG